MSGPGCAEPAAKLRCSLPVTQQAKGAEVIEIALSATLGDREDVVGVPKGAAGVDGLEAVYGKTGGTGRTPGALECGEDGSCIGVAHGADAAVTRENLVAEIAGIGPQPVLVHTVIRAEGAAAPDKDLEIAPAAKRQTVGTERQKAGIHAAARKSAGTKHDWIENKRPGMAGEVTCRVPRRPHMIDAVG